MGEIFSGNHLHMFLHSDSHSVAIIRLTIVWSLQNGGCKDNCLAGCNTV